MSLSMAEFIHSLDVKGGMVLSYIDDILRSASLDYSFVHYLYFLYYGGFGWRLSDGYMITI